MKNIQTQAGKKQKGFGRTPTKPLVPGMKLDKSFYWLMRDVIRKGLFDPSKAQVISAKEVVISLKYYHKLYVKWATTNGPTWSIKRLKGLYTFGCRVSLGTDPRSLPYFRCTPSGFPKVLKLLRKHLTASCKIRRCYALTVLRSLEIVRVPPDTDISTIVDKSRADFSAFDFETFKLIVASQFGSKEPNFRRSPSLLVRAGPNGPAMLTWHRDAEALRYSKCFKHWRTFCRRTNQRGVLRRFDRVIDYTRMMMFPEDKLRACRIGHTSDKFGKTRTFAMVNFWIQESTLELQHILYEVLGSLPDGIDGSFDHSAAGRKVLSAIAAGKPSVCTDLSSATDRFPIELQEIVLGLLFNKEVSKAWSSMVRSMEFWHESSQNEITYSVGQPMGLHGSWALFALTHHCLVQYCAYKVRGWREFAGFKFDDYIIIGDDICIFDVDVAEFYVRTLKVLGIDISLEKSVFTKGSAELAKRLFVGEHEISAIPPGLIDSLYTNPLNCIALFQRLQFIVDGVNEQYIDELLRSCVPGKRERFREKIKLALTHPSVLSRHVHNNPWLNVPRELVDDVEARLRAERSLEASARWLQYAVMLDESVTHDIDLEMELEEMGGNYHLDHLIRITVEKSLRSLNRATRPYSVGEIIDAERLTLGPEALIARKSSHAVRQQQMSVLRADAFAIATGWGPLNFNKDISKLLQRLPRYRNRSSYNLLIDEMSKRYLS